MSKSRIFSSPKFQSELNCFLVIIIGVTVFWPLTASATDPLQVQLATDSNHPIRKVWEALLEFANVAAFVAFLVVAFANILRIQIATYAVKKILPSIIIAIILANFSYLICRVLLDLSAGLANMFTGGQGFLNVWRDQFLISPGGLDSTKGFLWLFSGFMRIIAAVFILVLGVMFLLRIYVLYFLIALAPIAFISMALPFTKGIWTRWWKTYSQWVFMLPLAYFWLWLGSQFFSWTSQFNQTLGSDFNGISIAGYVFGLVCVWLAMTTPFKMAGELSSLTGKLQNMAMTATGVYAGTRLAQGAVQATKETAHGMALKYTPAGGITRAVMQAGAARKAAIEEGKTGPIARGTIFGKEVHFAGKAPLGLDKIKGGKLAKWLGVNAETGEVDWNSKNLMKTLGNVLTLGSANRGRRSLIQAGLQKEWLDTEASRDTAEDVRLQRGGLKKGTFEARTQAEEAKAALAKGQSDLDSRFFGADKSKTLQELEKQIPKETLNQYLELKKKGADSKELIAFLDEQAAKADGQARDKLAKDLGFDQLVGQTRASQTYNLDTSRLDVKKHLTDQGLSEEEAEKRFRELRQYLRDTEDPETRREATSANFETLATYATTTGARVSRALTAEEEKAVYPLVSAKIQGDASLGAMGLSWFQVKGMQELRRTLNLGRDMPQAGTPEYEVVKSYLSRLNTNLDEARKMYLEYLDDYEQRPQFWDEREKRLKWDPKGYGIKISSKGVEDSKSTSAEIGANGYIEMKDFFNEIFSGLYSSADRMQQAHRKGKNIYGDLSQSAAEPDYAEALFGVSRILTAALSDKDKALKVKYIGDDKQEHDAHLGQTIKNIVASRLGVSETGKEDEGIKLVNISMKGRNAQLHDELVGILNTKPEDDLGGAKMLEWIQKLVEGARFGNMSERKNATEIINQFGLTTFMGAIKEAAPDIDDLKQKLFRENQQAAVKQNATAEELKQIFKNNTRQDFIVYAEPERVVEREED